MFWDFVKVKTLELLFKTYYENRLCGSIPVSVFRSKLTQGLGRCPGASLFGS